MPSVTPLVTPSPPLNEAPYIHQVYDTDSGFDGRWACGAASALMAIQHYERLPAHEIWCPEFNGGPGHYSNYGFYASEEYNYRGTTYYYESNDASGNPAQGAYGYVLRNG